MCEEKTEVSKFCRKCERYKDMSCLGVPEGGDCLDSIEEAEPEDE